MGDSDDEPNDEPKRAMSVNYVFTDGPGPKTKGKKTLRIDPNNTKSRNQSKKHIKCDRVDEHANPAWINNYKPLYGPPLLSSFLVIDIQKIFRSRFRLPLLNRVTRSEGIDLLAELLGMYDLETNIISYWTLDVLSQVIRKCQSASMREENIKMCILWIHYILYMIHRKRPTRQKLFKHLCIMFNRAMWQLTEMVAIPHPYHINDEIEKQRTKKKENHASILKKKVEISNNTIINHEEEQKGIILEEEGMVPEEFIGLEEDILEEKTKEDLEEESSSEEEDIEEEEESEYEEGIEEDVGESSMENVSPVEDDDEEHPRLPDEANDLPDEIKEKLYLIANEVIEIGKMNQRDFFLLIKIIYRIFANRFKFTVIREAFVHPPRPKIIGIGNNIRIPKKVKIKKHAGTSVANVKNRISVKPFLVKPSSSSKINEDSLVKRFFPSMRKKPQKTKKKRAKYIRPLSEAVNQRFFDVIADQKYKEVMFGEYIRMMDRIRKRLNIKRTDYEKIILDLKALIAKSKKKRNVGHRAGRSGGKTTNVRK